MLKLFFRNDILLTENVTGQIRRPKTLVFNSVYTHLKVRVLPLTSHLPQFLLFDTGDNKVLGTNDLMCKRFINIAPDI